MLAPAMSYSLKLFLWITLIVVLCISACWQGFRLYLIFLMSHCVSLFLVVYLKWLHPLRGAGGYWFTFATKL
jgi:hypothetical protein